MSPPADESHDRFEVLRSDDADLEVRASRERFDRAAQAGHRRRRKKLSLVAGTSVALFAVGVASLTRGSASDRVVFNDRDTALTTERIEPSPVDPTVAPTTVVPISVATTPLATPITTSAEIPTATTLESGTQPGPGPSSELVNDLFVTVSDDRGAFIEVRDAAGVVASFDLPCSPGQDCRVESARVMGETIWVAISEYEPGVVDTVVRSRVLSASLPTGDVVEHLAIAGPTFVTSAGRGADGALYAHLVSWQPADNALVTIDDGQASEIAASVSGFRLSDDGRFLAVSFSNPSAGEGARFEITDLVENAAVGFETNTVNAGPGAWSPDGRFLIVNEQWEQRTAWVVDPWSRFDEPIAQGVDFIRDGACFISSDVVAHRTWNVGYGQGDAQVGVIRFTSLDSGSTTELGRDLFGDAFRCHADGSISLLRRPVVDVESSPGFVQPEPDYEAPVELIHIATDGTMSSRAVGNLRMV